MLKLVNDEIEPSSLQEMMQDRERTRNIRLRNVGAGRVLLEQYWIASSAGIAPAWIPVTVVPE